MPTREAEEPAALTPGQHLQAIHHAYFNGGGWVDPLTWDDYDEAGHARWEAFAAVIGRNIAKAAAAPDLLEACLHVRRVNAKAAAEGYLKPEEWGAELFACNAALSAAITKATNEASPLGAEPGSTGIDGGREEQITQPSHDDEGLIEEGFSSARSSRDARSSTRPEGPCSDEGGEA